MSTQAYATGVSAAHDLKTAESFDPHDQTYSVSESDTSGASEEDASGWSAPDSEPDLTADDVTIDENGYLALKEDSPVPAAAAAAAAAGPPSWKDVLLKHEVPRKVFHSAQGVPSLYLFVTDVDHHKIAYPLWALFAVLCAVEYARLNYPAVNNAVMPWVKYLTREREWNSCNGTVYYLAGCALVLTFASRDVSIVSILLLSWGDTAASTFGRAFGKYTPQIAKGKSLAGSLASAATGVIVTYSIYGVIIPRYAHLGTGSDIMWTAETSKFSLPVFALATGVVTAISEAVDVLGLDDNLTIPVLCSLFMTAMIRVFQK